MYFAFYSSNEVLVTPFHYAKVFYGHIMTSDVVMVIHWGRGLLIFLKPLSKCSEGFCNILLNTPQPITCVSVYDSALSKDGIFVILSHKEVLDGHPYFEVDLHPIFFASSLQALTVPFYNKLPP